jgi:hypothetical protein
MKEFILPPIKHYPSRRDWEKACWKKLISSPEILDLIATSRERHTLTLRAGAISRINEGRRPHQIAKELFLSRQTIDALRKAAREHVYRSYWERSKTERKRGSRENRVYPTERARHSRPVRTKYGTVYVP